MTATARGTVTAARVRGGRVLLDVTLLSGETRSRVELLQPYGFTAVPAAGAEVLVQELARRGHLVALLADAPALRVTDAAPGEIGIRDAQGQQVMFRGDGIEISGALKVTIVSAGEVQIQTSSATVTSAGNVVVAAPAIKLGSAGAVKRVKLEDDSNATKVFAE